MIVTKLNPIEASSRTARVTEALRDAIYAGKLRPGEPLRELPLARQLGVSQTTIREALLHLERAGLVTRQANHGSRITELASEDVAERVSLRIVLEGMAASDAARRAGPEDVCALRRALGAIAAAAGRNSYYEAAQADLEFHRCLWRMSGNRTLYRLLDELTLPLFAFVSVVHSRDMERLDALTARHEPIVEAVGAGNPAAARKLVREHVRGSYGRFSGKRGDKKPSE